MLRGLTCRRDYNEVALVAGFSLLCWDSTAHLSAKAFACSEVANIEESMDRVLPSPISSARIPPQLSLGACGFLVPSTMCWKLNETVNWNLVSEGSYFTYQGRSLLST